MSINSPAKQERIERHLMRQRGAGIRTISASFGFSFGSASSSNYHTPAPEEPTAKRRKTILQNVVLPTESTTVADANGPKLDAAKSAKSMKARRRLDLENDIDNTPRKYEADANDSFVCRLETKRVATKENKKKKTVPAQFEQGTNAVALEPATKGRPKRHAAAKAESRVTDGFAEEALPVDKTRRDAELEKKPKNTRGKQNGVVEIGSNPCETSVRTQNVSESSTIRPVKGTWKRPKATRAIVEVPAEHCSLPVDQVEMVDSENKAKPAKPAKSNSRKRKKSDPPIERLTTREIDERPRSKPQHGVEKPPNDTVNVEADTNVPKKRSRKKTVEKTTVDKSLAAKMTSDSRRQPLMETDMNLTMRSTSPEKPSTKDENASPIYTKGAGISKYSATTEHASRKPSKRLKAKVRQNHEDLEGNLKNHVVKRDEAVIEKTTGTVGEGEPIRSATMTKPVEKLPGIANATMSTAGKPKKSVRTASAELERPLQEAPAKDEDVDWLFDPQPPKQQPILSQITAKGRRTASKARTKIPDIDLDDLLSNIASFAKTDSLDATENGSEGAGRKGKASTRQKVDG